MTLDEVKEQFRQELKHRNNEEYAEKIFSCCEKYFSKMKIPPEMTNEEICRLYKRLCYGLRDCSILYDVEILGMLGK